MHQKSFQQITSTYLKKYRFQNHSISAELTKDTSLIITIPCFNEKHLIESLESLKQCVPPKGKVEVLIQFNGSALNDAIIQSQNKESIKQFDKWNDSNDCSFIRFYKIVNLDLPKKHAGVGLARKIAMDEAVVRFSSISTDGVIVCFDADSLVEPNYLIEIERAFSNQEVGGASIHFEHPYQSIEDAYLKNGIIQYELHLRYYVNALKFSQYPFAYHTIGSSMVVRTSVYCLAAGMNRRKAGEDFYFLHKIIPNTKFINITTTKVIPSPRISERVPFGTGRAQLEWKENKQTILKSYNPLIFKDLRIFIKEIPKLIYCSDERSMDDFIKKLPACIQAYLSDQNFTEIVLEAFRNTRNEQSFLKRIYAWFDGFKVLKMVHFLRDNFYPNVTITEASIDLLKLLNEVVIENDKEALLEKYRLMDQV